MSTVLFKDQKNFPLIANVMVIDDQLTSRLIMESIIKGIGDNIKVFTFESAISALESAYKSPPDLIVVDYKMPDMNGVEFTRQVRSLPECMDVPIIVFTIVDDKSVMYEALDAGATDFLTKPIDHYECKVRCRNLLTIRRQQIIIKERAITLEQFVHDTKESIQLKEKELLKLVNKITDFKGNYIGYHPLRMGMISMLIAKEMRMDKKFCNLIEAASPLHDIGEILIPSYIYLKSGTLNQDEIDIIRQHTTNGHELLNNYTSSLLKLAATIALTHHERFDGTGYPNNLKGYDISIESRIAAVADAYNAMTSPRNYRPAYTSDEAIEIIVADKGKAYDPKCADALVKNINEINLIDDNSLISS